MELEETLLHYLQAGRLCTNRQKLGLDSTIDEQFDWA